MLREIKLKKEVIPISQKILEELEELYQTVLVTPGEETLHVQVDNSSFANHNQDYPETTMSYKDFYSVIPESPEVIERLQMLGEPIPFKLPPFLLSKLLKKGTPAAIKDYQQTHGQQYRNKPEQDYTNLMTRRV